MSSQPGAGPPKELPRRIGGYRIVGDLGRGRLGPVVEARHVASGRIVALHVLRPEWACQPKYVARLVRDAYAATQLDHPNLVRLLEIGEAQGRIHAAAERPDGPSLAERVAGRGALPAREAVVHVLQTARALMFLHANGLTHGDVRPAGLFVSADGVTKLADLGLVTTPERLAEEERRETAGPIALAEAPEGDLEARAVRADVQGLGSTLEALITGRLEPPADEPGGPSSLIARGVPSNLVELVSGLADARPDGPFRDASKAAAMLEQFLNARKPGSTAPRENDTQALSNAIAAFRAAPSARLRTQAALYGLAVVAVLIVFSLIGRRFFLTGSLVGLIVMAELAYRLMRDATGRTGLFERLRQLAFECRPIDRISVLAGLAVFLSALWVLGLLGLWIFLGAAAIGYGLVVHRVLDRRVDAERKASVDEARALLQTLRLRGVSEDALRRFVRVTAGDDWSPFVEAVLGHEAAVEARASSEGGRTERVLSLVRNWPDRLEARLDSALDSLRQARVTPFLEQVEERSQTAQGVNLLTARRRAWRVAAAMVAVSSRMRAAARGRARDVAEPPSIARAVRQAAESPEHVLIEHERGLIGRDPSVLVGLISGPRTRFLLGMALLAGFLLWVDQNGIVSGARLRDVAARAIEAPDRLESIRNARIEVRLDAPTKPLELSWVPRPILGLFRGPNAGVAGLILVLSAMVRGSRVGFFALPGAGLAILWPALGLPGAGPLEGWAVGSAVGAGVAALGLFFGSAPGD